jgi:hypothetical protein
VPDFVNENVSHLLGNVKGELNISAGVEMQTANPKVGRLSCVLL